MPRRQRLVPQAQQALDQLKYEVAQELGGNMVRRMILMAEQQLAGKL